jgi:hypothetical protein
MNTLKESVDELEGLLSMLPAKSIEFAKSLIDQYRVKGELSPKQEPYIHTMIAQAKNPYKYPSIEVGDFDGVIELFHTAQSHLKFPKIVLQAAGNPIHLSLAGVKSKFPGTISVAGPGKYPEREWYGRVDANGNWTPSKGITPQMAEALFELLIEFAHDPAAVAQKQGVLAGVCCFCSKTLTEEHSTKAGFGPICAQHFGLYEQWKNMEGA